MNHFCPIPVADRAHSLREGAEVPDPKAPLPPATAAALRKALLDGETHYTPRPGLPELQEEIAGRLEAAGAPPGGTVVITGGRREALFVALAGARRLADNREGERTPVMLSPGAARARGVFEACAALELAPIPLAAPPLASPPTSVVDGRPAAVVLTAAETAPGAPLAVPVGTLSPPPKASPADRPGAGPDRAPPEGPLAIADCGSDLLAPDRDLDLSGVPPGAVLFGSLDGLPELVSFRVGFFRAPTAVLVPLRTLKQAISICTPAPSQRASALLLEAGPTPLPPAPTPLPAEGAAARDDSRYSLMELAARLEGVISLGRGDPDADAPAPVIEAASAATSETEPLDPRGQRWLRERIAAREEARTGVPFDPDTEVLVTGGAQEGITLAMLALVGEREDVLLGDPRYTSYQQAIALAKGRMALIPCGSGEDPLDFGLSAQAAAAALSRTARPRLLAIVNFSNPTGARTRPPEIRALCRLADRHHLWVLADEVYAAMPFDGEGPVLSPASLPGMKNRTLTLGSVSKSYAMTGFRTGWITGPADAIGACARLKAALSGPTALFSQRAAAAALDGGDRWPARLRRIYAPRRRRLLDGLAALEIPTAVHGGGFFVWADISRFGLPAERFCRRLLLEARVLMFPGTAFGKRWDRYVRVSMLQSGDLIAEALARVRRFAP